MQVQAAARPKRVARVYLELLELIDHYDLVRRKMWAGNESKQASPRCVLHGAAMQVSHNNAGRGLRTGP